MGDFAITHSQSRILKDLADDAFQRVHRHSYGFFADSFVGSLVAKVKRYVDSFETLHDQVIFTVWMRGIQLVSGVVVLTYFSPLLGMLFLAWLVLYVMMTVYFTRRKIPKDLAHSAANSKKTGALADAMTNVLNMKMFSSSKREHAIFGKVTEFEQKKRSDAWWYQNIQQAAQGYFIGFFEVIGMAVAIYLWINGTITVGTIVLVQVYLFSAFSTVWDIGRNFSRTVQAVADAQEMVEIFQLEEGVKDPDNPLELSIENGQIDIEKITFAYGKAGNVFQNFSLNIQPGEKIGLVGTSGAGKTTITKLLLRFSDVQKGTIMIDGQDIARLKQDDVRSVISYVPQDPVLFHRTLSENIAYSKPSATKKEIIQAAKSAHAHEFIGELENGYKTLVGERGIKLSGGQRQRVAIARAMLKDAPILVLDEATSSLDSLSEKYIQDAFNTLMKGRTTIVIAHRLSTIQKMDRIIVLEKGKIVEEGSHNQLVKNKGQYHKLWRQQSHGFMGE